MTPAELIDQIEARLFRLADAGRHPFRAGHQLAAARFGLTLEIAAAGVARLGGLYARVAADPNDPRLFVLAPEGDPKAGTPALLLPIDAEQPDDADVLALSLAAASRRFWRLTARCSAVGEKAPTASGVLRLRQEAHAYFGSVIKAAAHQAACRAEAERAYEDAVALATRRAGGVGFAEALKRPADDPERQAFLRGLQQALRLREAIEQRWAIACRGPDGTLVLDPAAIGWTRREALADAEAVEIVDAPADGPLGRALKRLNPRIGTPLGVPLYGQAPEKKTVGRKAA